MGHINNINININNFYCLNKKSSQFIKKKKK